MTAKKLKGRRFKTNNKAKQKQKTFTQHIIRLWNSLPHDDVDTNHLV